MHSEGHAFQLAKHEMNPFASNATSPWSQWDGPVGLPTPTRPGHSTSHANLRLKRHLSFLGSLGNLVLQCGNSLEQVFSGLVHLLPLACQSPEDCCARAIVHDQCFSTPNWRGSPWIAEADICSQKAPVGKLQLAYLAPHTEAENHPIPHDEHALLVFVGTLLGKTVERLEAIAQLQTTVEQLRVERSALEQANAALRGILDQIEEERKTTRRTVTTNVDSLVMPVVQALEAQATPQQRPLITILKSRLDELASPFADKLSRTFANLTPLEISLCRMIRDNLSTKEIAKIRHVSPSTVAHQREQIRRKLGIARTDTNLATYLRTRLPEAGP